MCAHYLQRAANTAPEWSNVAGCLAERLLQTIQCGALLPEVALHVRNAFMCVVRGVVKLVLGGPKASNALLDVAVLPC